MFCASCGNAMDLPGMEEYCHHCGEPCCAACLDDEWCPACRRGWLVQELTRSVMRKHHAVIVEEIRNTLKNHNIDIKACRYVVNKEGETEVYHGKDMLLRWKPAVATENSSKNSIIMTWEVMQ